MAENAPITPLSNYIDQIKTKEVQAHADLIDENDFDKKFKAEYEKLVQIVEKDKTLDDRTKTELLQKIDKSTTDNLCELNNEIKDLETTENNALKTIIEEYNNKALYHLESLKTDVNTMFNQQDFEIGTINGGKITTVETTGEPLTVNESINSLNEKDLVNNTDKIKDILNNPPKLWQEVNKKLANILYLNNLNDSQLIDFGKKIQEIIKMPIEDRDGRIGPKTMKKMAEFLKIENTTQTAQPTKVKEEKPATEKTVKTEKITPTIDLSTPETTFFDENKPIEKRPDKLMQTPLPDDNQAVKKAESNKETTDKTEPKPPEATKEDAEILAKVQDLLSKMQANLTPNFKISELFISKIDEKVLVENVENKFKMKTGDVMALNNESDQKKIQFITELVQLFLNPRNKPKNITDPKEIQKLIEEMNEAITRVETVLNNSKAQITKTGAEWTSKYFDYGTINPNNLNVTLSSNTEVVRKNEDRALNLSSDEYYKKNSPINLNDGLTPGYYPSEMTIDEGYPRRLIITDKVINSNESNGGKRQTRVFVFKKVQNTNNENYG